VAKTNGHGRQDHPGELALVFLWDGRTYDGRITVEDGLIHFDGRRRVVTDGQTTHRPAGARKWPLQAVREIRPLEQTA
jgi:hypothetical protein